MSGRQLEATRKALEYFWRKTLDKQSVSVYAAAKKFGIYPSTLHRALQRKEKK